MGIQEEDMKVCASATLTAGELFSAGVQRSKGGFEAKLELDWNPTCKPLRIEISV